MAMQLDRRTLLLASDQQDRRALRALLDAPLFNGWVLLVAYSIELAVFVLQLTPCEVLLLDAALYRGSDPEAVVVARGLLSMQALVLHCSPSRRRGSSSARCRTAPASGCRGSWR